MQTSLFTHLSKYASSSKVRPLENFLTELIAWSINQWPEFGSEFCSRLDSSLVPLESLKATTQVGLSGDGIADLVIEYTSTSGEQVVLIVESKVEAEVGTRTATTEAPIADRGVDDEVMLDEPVNDANTQINNYLRYASSRKYARVVLVSKYQVNTSQYEDDDNWGGSFRWKDLRPFLETKAALRGAEYQFLAKEMLAFFRDNQMTIEKVEPALLAGSEQRQRLRRVFEDAARQAADITKLKVRVGQDRWSFYLGFSDGGEPMAWIAYSDEHQDAAFVVDRTSSTLAQRDAMRNTLALKDLVDIKRGRWWDGAYCELIDLHPDGKFFAMDDGDGQRDLIADRTEECLKALLMARSE